MPYQTSSPLLFIIFNRPDTTLTVFERIREAKPKRLYIAADGPRTSREDEEHLCSEARKVIEQVDWDCSVETLFREKNLGCKYAVSSAVDWFFSKEEEGIILEDDCLPSNDFFRFCDEMLVKYRYDSRIRHITGCNLQYGKKWGDATYYFSRNVHVWGWASWKRVWNSYDVELSKYQRPEAERQFSNVFSEQLLIQSWVDIFQQLKDGKIDTWDYQVGIINFFENGLCVIPNCNLVSNIGFGQNATHTFNEVDRNANIPHEDLPAEVIHPEYILAETKADSLLLNRDFDIENRLKKLRKKERKMQIKRLLGFK
ncbi:nucleotide-diphospho-sugar transferase [Pedobacter sp. HMF7647]|uniref:Nucleotide-diphospho-sugar transferase n=1 Tax=Hufsiella arboris TaxID=2695275 RepID=A0A7K1Y6H2_9SPHI|nr:nucleotide-diphospho-sugar transferase [Hufsiella arboris]MXV50011.1 nucleotide-diphospho-sugar transferase [Hufsiella arboris]